MRPLSDHSFTRFFTVSLAFIMSVWVLVSSSSLSALELGAYKDNLFAYPKALETRDNGDYRLLDYNKQIHIHKRDEIPVQRVQSRYVRMGVRRHQTFENFSYGGRSFEVASVAKKGNPKFGVIFIHGRNGDRKLGMSDYIFGGNFNRLKNLAVRNNGIYISPSMRDFGNGGTLDISALISYLHQERRVGKIVLVCASMGSQICSRIAKRQADVARVSGLVILGGAPDGSLASSHAAAMGLPIILSHGTQDNVYSWQAQRKVYQRLKGRTARYPAQIILFQSGVHGTPIRMIDWRQSLNWIFRRS